LGNLAEVCFMITRQVIIFGKQKFSKEIKLIFFLNLVRLLMCRLKWVLTVCRPLRYSITKISGGLELDT